MKSQITIILAALLFMACGQAPQFSGPGVASNGINNTKGNAQEDRDQNGDDCDDELGEIPSSARIRCDENDREKKCIVLCHVPPGNPSAQHSLVLPRPAVTAHLREHDASGDASPGDYLGYCKRPGQDY